MKQSIILLITLVGAISAATNQNSFLKDQIKAKSLAQAEAKSLDDGGVEGDGWEGCEIPEGLGECELGELHCPCNFSTIPGLGAGLS